MLADTLFLKPLTQAADGDARCLTHSCVAVRKTSFDEGPDLVHERRHKLATSFHAYTER